MKLGPRLPDSSAIIPRIRRMHNAEKVPFLPNKKRADEVCFGSRGAPATPAPRRGNNGDINKKSVPVKTACF